MTLPLKMAKKRPYAKQPHTNEFGPENSVVNSILGHLEQLFVLRSLDREYTGCLDTIC